MAFAAGARLLASRLNDFDPAGRVRAGTTVEATTPRAVNSSQAASGTTASTTYTATLSGGTACSATFVAPTSGSVLVLLTCDVNNSVATNYSIVGVELRTGAVVGSGTVVGVTLQGGTDDSQSLFGQGYIWKCSFHHPFSGLTAGNTYNVRTLFRVNAASTGTFQRKHMTVLPFI